MGSASFESTEAAALKPANCSACPSRLQSRCRKQRERLLGLVESELSSVWMLSAGGFIGFAKARKDAGRVAPVGLCPRAFRRLTEARAREVTSKRQSPPPVAQRFARFHAQDP